MKKILTALILVATLLCVALLSGCNLGNLSGVLYLPDFDVKIDGHSHGCSSFGEAWKEANENTDKEVIITCNTDVVAVDGRFGDYGELTVNPRTAPLTIDMNGNTIDRGLESPINSGAVFDFRYQTGEITIKNGTITGGNSLNEHGGGIYIDSEDLFLTLDNVTITGNNTQINGGGMFINGCNANVVLKDVTITGNSAAYAGGFHWDERGGTMPTVKFIGNIDITNNTTSGDANFSNFVISKFPGNSSKLYLEEFSEESTINLALEENIDIPFTQNLGENAVNYQKCFVSQRNSLKIAVSENNELYFTIDEENNTTIAAGVYRNNWGYWEYFDSAANAWSEANDHETAVTMKLFKDWIGENGNLGTSSRGFLDGAMRPLSRDVDDWFTFDLNGYTINRGLTKDSARDNGCIFVMSDGYSPHINLKNGTLTGGSNKNHGGAIDYRADHGIFLLENVTITGNYSAAAGGAIYYDSDDNNLWLRDVTITGNENPYMASSRNYNGAVYLYMDKPFRKKTIFLKLYGKTKIKDNINGDMYVYGGYGIYAELSDDIEPGSFVLRQFPGNTKQSEKFIEINGNPEKTLRAFQSDSTLYLAEHDGKTYIDVK